MRYMLRVIRACCAPSGSLPQDRQKSTSRKRKARDSCWGKMHQSAWLKALISCCGVWNEEEWSLWRNSIVYLFTFVVLIFPPNEQIFHNDWVRSGMLNLLFVSGMISWDAKKTSIRGAMLPLVTKWHCFMLMGKRLLLLSLSSVFQVVWQRWSPLGRAEQNSGCGQIQFSNGVWNPKLIQMYDLPSLCLLLVIQPNQCPCRWRTARRWWKPLPSEELQFFP